jgi:sodium-dependent phosphate cotransporter
LPALREIPIQLANGLGRITLKYRLAGFLYLLLMFFIIPFSLIYFNRDAVKVTELTYRRVVNDQSTYYTVIAKTFENQAVSNWIVYPEKAIGEPSQIYSVYRKNNLLIINNELYELNTPGFCRDGQDRDGKYEMCIRQVLPELTLNPSLSFDSVFVFEKKYERANASSVWCYVSSAANLIVRKETRDTEGHVATSEELFSLVEK